MQIKHLELEKSQVESMNEKIRLDCKQIAQRNFELEKKAQALQMQIQKLHEQGDVIERQEQLISKLRVDLKAKQVEMDNVTKDIRAQVQQLEREKLNLQNVFSKEKRTVLKLTEEVERLKHEIREHDDYYKSISEENEKLRIENRNLKETQRRLEQHNQALESKLREMERKSIEQEALTKHLQEKLLLSKALEALSPKELHTTMNTNLELYNKIKLILQYLPKNQGSENKGMNDEIEEARKSLSDWLYGDVKHVK